MPSDLNTTATSSLSRRHWLTGLCAGVLALTATVCSAGDVCCNSTTPRSVDQVWLISNRCLGCPDASGAEPALSVELLTNQGWQKSNLATFFAADGALPTCVWAHGNRTDACLARQEGLSVYHKLVSCQGDDRPVRFVIWSWPSDQEGGPLNDVRIKAPRADVAGYYLAYVLDRMSPSTPVRLIGYSYGSRVVTSALQLTAGGTVAGQTLRQRQHPDRAPLKTALLAAAEDCDWLLPGHRHGLALSKMDELLLVNNTCDRALRYYHYLYGRKCDIEALGYVGLAKQCLTAADQAKVTQIDACCLVGSEHEWSNYFAVPTIVARLQALVFGPAAK